MYGLTCDGLRSAQVVLPGGRTIVCDERRDADLFWALRGGGNGTVGVVTSLEFGTVPAPASTAFHLTWPYPAAAAVIQAWQAWSPDASDELAASLLISAAANTARAPVISVFGAMAGAEAACRTALDELAARVGPPPASAAFRHGSHRQVKRYLSTLDVHGDGPRPDGVPTEDDGHAYSKSEFFAQTLPADAVAALVDHLTRDRMPGQSRELDFTPWGGAYNRVPVEAAAFPHRDARFLLKQAVVVDAGASAAERRAATRWLVRSWELAHRWGTGGVYPNFPDPDLPDPDVAYYGANLPRLREVIRTYGRS
jgi:FAD/FMN-containing dehydrogenase